jgi:hypothetical protein
LRIVFAAPYNLPSINGSGCIEMRDWQTLDDRVLMRPGAAGLVSVTVLFSVYEFVMDDPIDKSLCHGVPFCRV